MKIDGFYLNGETSKQADACLEVLRGSDNLIRLTVQYEGLGQEVLNVGFDDIHIESRIGNTPREMVIKDKCLFTSEDHHSIDQLSKLVSKNPMTHGFIHKIESNLVFVILGVVICCITSWATVVYGVPKAANYIAFNMPDFVNNKLGSSLSVLDRTLFEPSELDGEEQARILSMMSQYNQAFQDLNPSLHFRLGMGANAFALPSGDIVFTDGFVKLAQTDDELRSVYFHELGHLAHKHMTRRALQGTMLSIIVLLITGDIENFDMLVGIPVLLTDLSYSRDFEREADDFAFDTMKEYGVPVTSFADVMQRLEASHAEEQSTENREESEKSKKTSWLEYMSTHPSTKERIERMRALSNEGE